MYKYLQPLHNNGRKVKCSYIMADEISKIVKMSGLVVHLDSAGLQGIMKINQF